MASLEVLLAVAVLGSTLFTALLLTLPSRYTSEAVTDAALGSWGSSSRTGTSTTKRSPKTTVQVLVLGDIGRSPRMQYHACSIAKNGGQVVLIGYKDSDIHPEILSTPLISIIPLPSPPKILRTNNKLLFLLCGPLKVVWQIWCLWIVLGYRTKPARWLLVQNPPSIPTLAVSQIICIFRQTKLVIDWHNLGFSILALKLGSSHPLVRISKWYETYFARSATANISVSNAMARVLNEDYHITSPIIPLHDRPSIGFQPISSSERSLFLSRLPDTVLYTDALLSGKMKLLVSSTSWTADEDFSLLLDALAAYSEMATTTHPHLPEILVIITGKGPQKDHYLARVAELDNEDKLEMVTILAAWLKAEDYASLLGAADLGVSLHTSSSGVDLPMKVVDMFGAGLPVVGWDRFEAWPELVQEGVNGMGFGSKEQLRNLLVELFEGDGDRLRRLRAGALHEGNHRWDAEWEPKAGKLFGVCSK
ncbi:MAG: mannosyltransferase [Candelina submexicana]|nr:MAG: mannosyltransferase [Candelina submexicana]